MRGQCQTITLTRINNEPWRAFVCAMPGTTKWTTGAGSTPQAALASLWADAHASELVPVPPLALPHPSFRGEFLSVRETIQLACAFVGVNFIDLAGPGRHAATVARRRMVWHLVYTRGDGHRTTFSWPEIAAASGKKSHSTLLTSVALVASHIGSPDMNEAEQQWATVVATRVATKCGPGCERILEQWAGRANQRRSVAIPTTTPSTTPCV